MKLGRWIALVVVVLVLAWWFWPEPAISHPPGVLVREDPEQLPVSQAQRIQLNGYQIIPLAKFRVKALVLHRERYRFDRGAALSPLDLALGWGPMSDQSVVDQFDITQSYRWYHWQAKHMPIPTGEVITHSANMHMIPASDDVEETLLSAIRGDIVDIQGYLVEVHGQKGWKWVSSLRRDDTGDGSCEVVYVEKATVRE